MQANLSRAQVGAIVEYILEHGGITYDCIAKEHAPAVGYAVSIRAAEQIIDRDLSRAALVDAVAAYLEDRDWHAPLYLGAWIDDTQGRPRLYLDCTAIYRGYGDAIAAAAAEEQIAIYDLSAGKTLYMEVAPAGL